MSLFLEEVELSVEVMACDDYSSPEVSWEVVIDKSLAEIVPSHWFNFKPPSKFDHYLLGSIYIILMSTGLAANGTIILLFSRCKSLRTPSNILVLNLAISDFFMIAKTPVFIYNSFNCGPILGQFGCQIYGFIGGLTGTSAIMTIAAMAAERFHTISRPLGRRLTTGRALIMVSFIWMYALTFSSMPLLGIFTRYVPEGFLTSCSFDYLSPDLESRLFIFSFFIAAFCVPITIIIASYIGIFIAVKKSQLNLNIPNSSKTHSDVGAKKCKSRQRVELKLAKIAAFLIILWLLSWTPYAVVALLGIFSDQSLLTPTTSMVPALFAKMASVIDPFVYGHSHPRFRYEIRRLIGFSPVPRQRTTLMATRGITVAVGDDA